MAYNYGNYNNYNQNQGMQYSNGQYYQTHPNYQYQMLQAPQQSRPVNNLSRINWVQGQAGANAFPLGPGESALLMDSEDSVLYVKSVDVSGRPLPLEIYDLVKRNTVVPMSTHGSDPAQIKGPDMTQYVKMSDLESMVNDLVNKALEK